MRLILLLLICSMPVMAQAPLATLGDSLRNAHNILISGYGTSPELEKALRQADHLLSAQESQSGNVRVNKLIAELNTTLDRAAEEIGPPLVTDLTLRKRVLAALVPAREALTKLAGANRLRIKSRKWQCRDLASRKLVDMKRCRDLKAAVEVVK